MHREFLGRLCFGQTDSVAGIRLRTVTPAARKSFVALLEQLGLSQFTKIHSRVNGTLDASLTPGAVQRLMPRFESLNLCERLEPVSAPTLKCEIVTALLGSPLLFEYHGIDEFEAAIRVRTHIVEAAYRTQLAFDTKAAERPWDYWSYDENRGFTVRPGKSLIEALRKATQPDTGEHKYAFSCVRTG